MMQDLLGKHEISGIGLAVSDVIATARQYGALLGVGPWELHDHVLDDGRHLRTAMGRIGRLSVELFEPMSQEVAGRFHHVSLGGIEDFGGVLEDLKGRDVPVDLRSDSDNGSYSALLDTAALLGTQVSFHKVTDGHMPAFARYVPDPGLVNIGEKEIAQLGIVVDDVQRCASNWTDIFGIEDWSFLDFTPTSSWRGIYRGMPVEGELFYIKAALAMFGEMQIELLQPVSGISTHMDFYRLHGTAVHHVSFGQVPDHDELVSKLGEAGIEVEMAGEVGAGAWFTYLRTAERLGTIFEMVGNAG